MTMTLIAVALGVIWVFRAYFLPFAPCRRCQGSSKNRWSSKKRWGPCKKCGGSGKRQVLGSRRVHRAVRALASGKAGKRWGS